MTWTSPVMKSMGIALLRVTCGLTSLNGPCEGKDSIVNCKKRWTRNWIGDSSFEYGSPWCVLFCFILPGLDGNYVINATPCDCADLPPSHTRAQLLCELFLTLSAKAMRQTQWRTWRCHNDWQSQEKRRRSIARCWSYSFHPLSMGIQLCWLTAECSLLLLDHRMTAKDTATEAILVGPTNIPRVAKNLVSINLMVSHLRLSFHFTHFMSRSPRNPCLRDDAGSVVRQILWEALN